MEIINILTLNCLTVLCSINLEQGLSLKVLKSTIVLIKCL